MSPEVRAAAEHGVQEELAKFDLIGQIDEGSGETPLHLVLNYIALYQDSTFEALDFLLDCYEFHHVPDNYGVTPFQRFLHLFWGLDDKEWCDLCTRFVKDYPVSKWLPTLLEQHDWPTFFAALHKDMKGFIDAPEHVRLVCRAIHNLKPCFQPRRGGLQDVLRGSAWFLKQPDAVIWETFVDDPVSHQVIWDTVDKLPINALKSIIGTKNSSFNIAARIRIFSKMVPLITDHKKVCELFVQFADIGSFELLQHYVAQVEPKHVSTLWQPLFETAHTHNNVRMCSFAFDHSPVRPSTECLQVMLRQAAIGCRPAALTKYLSILDPDNLCPDLRQFFDSLFEQSPFTKHSNIFGTYWRQFKRHVFPTIQVLVSRGFCRASELKCMLPGPHTMRVCQWIAAETKPFKDWKNVISHIRRLFKTVGAPVIAKLDWNKLFPLPTQACHRSSLAKVLTRHVLYNCVSIKRSGQIRATLIKELWPRLKAFLRRLRHRSLSAMWCGWAKKRLNPDCVRKIVCMATPLLLEFYMAPFYRLSRGEQEARFQQLFESQEWLDMRASGLCLQRCVSKEERDRLFALHGTVTGFDMSADIP